MQRLFTPPDHPHFGDLLWGGADTATRAGIMSLAERAANRDGFFALTVIPRYCPDDPSDAFEGSGGLLLSVATRRSRRQDGTTVLRLQDEKRDLSGVVAICPGQLDGVWLVLTDMKRSSDEYLHLVEPLLQLTAAKVPGAWLRSADMRDILFEVEGKLGLTLTADKVSSRNRERSSVEYMKGHRPIASVFEELAKRELVLWSMDFSCISDKAGTVLRAGLDKWTRLKYRGGSFLPFDRHLVPAAEALLVQHVRRLGVSRDAALQDRPVVFRFVRDALVSRERNEELIRTLAGSGNVSVCAFHVNPYLHVGVVDYADGSNMDLFADDAATLTVIPGKRCSIAAISRVLSSVYACFAPGEIVGSELSR